MCISRLNKAGFKVRVILIDSHSTNVNAFKILPSENDLDKQHFFVTLGTETTHFLLFDSVQLFNIMRNNVLDSGKLVFPRFDFHVCETYLISGPDNLLQANLRKTPKLSYTALHPNNIKQNVDLVPAFFYDTAIGACSSCLSRRPEEFSFIQLISCWWSVANAGERYSHKTLTQDITTDDGKIHFCFQLADWIET